MPRRVYTGGAFLCKLPDVMLYALMGLAVFYATRFCTRGTFPLMKEPRDAFVERWGVYSDTAKHKRHIPICVADPLADSRRTNWFMRLLAYLWECDWCLGFWVSGVTVLVTDQYTSVPLPWLAWLALAVIPGIMSQLERDK